MQEIKIGTRGSKLALWQAYYIEEKLKKAGFNTSIKIIDTKGDQILDRALSKIGSKGLFTEELEQQLLNGQIDIAVHSAKDLPSDLGPNFEIIAFTEREKPNDVLVSRNNNLRLSQKEPITIGTSSTRRTALLRAYYPQHRIVDMRGNLQTRIKKLDDGHCDAILLAFAGVSRMEQEGLIAETLSTEEFTPAVGQGSVAVEMATKCSPQLKAAIKEACNHKPTETCLVTERAFLKEMEGGCSIPVFGWASLKENKEIELIAGIISLNGQKKIRLKKSDTNPKNLGRNVANELLSLGGKEILEEIRKELQP